MPHDEGPRCCISQELVNSRSSTRTNEGDGLSNRRCGNGAPVAGACRGPASPLVSDRVDAWMEAWRAMAQKSGPSVRIDCKPSGAARDGMSNARTHAFIVYGHRRTDLRAIARACTTEADSSST